MTIDIAAIEELVTRVDARLPGDRCRVIGFVASGAGEGNSALAKAYVSALATRRRRKVLLLRADGKGGSGRLMHALEAKAPMDHLVRSLSTGGSVALLAGADPESALWDLVNHDDLWIDLRDRFDDIVLDLPAAGQSKLGLALAPHCDGVIVVLEAAKTRAPVVAHLISRLHAVKANVLGTVLNKRRYYLPARIYRWL